MALPKRKISRSRRDKRRTHKKISLPPMSMCPQCREIKQPHTVCPKCGFYAGREVLPVEEI